MTRLSAALGTATALLACFASAQDRPNFPA